MVLENKDIEPLDTLFDHSRFFSQGSGRVRKGQSTYIVAKDGSGDFDNVFEAVQSANKTGGQVFIKEGVYTERAITLNSNVSLIGTGGSTILRAKSGVSTFITIGTNVNNVNIENIFFDGQNVSGSKCIYSSSELGVQVSIRNNLFYRWDIALNLISPFGWIISGNSFLDVYKSILLYGEARANVISNNVFSDSNLLWSPQGNTVKIQFDSTGYDYGAQLNVISNNTSVESVGKGIYIKGSGDSHNSVISNYFGSVGIYTSTSGGYNVIVGNYASSYTLHTTDKVGHNDNYSYHSGFISLGDINMNSKNLSNVSNLTSGFITNSYEIVSPDFEFTDSIYSSNAFFYANQSILQLDKDVTNFWSPGYAHLRFNNDSFYGQTTLWFMKSNFSYPLGKIRVDYLGNFNYGAIGAYYWFAGNIDYYDGSYYHQPSMVLVPNSGNTYLKIYETSGSHYIGFFTNGGYPYISMDGYMGYTGYLNDSTNTAIGYVIGGIIVDVYY
jgi:hypothetical protein